MFLLILAVGKGGLFVVPHDSRSRKSSGVEVDHNLCNIAQHNAEIVHGRKTCIKIINASAVDFDYRRGTVYYLFNPFGARTLNSVLVKMEQSLRLQPRNIKIAYVNPVHGFLFSKADWLVMYDKWEAGSQIGLTYDVSFWGAKQLVNAT